MPTPQAHLQNALDNLSTTVAVITTGTTAAAAVWMDGLDIIAKLLAIVATLLNIIWVIMQMRGWARKKTVSG